ncbi:hypothetical protein C8R46DRAFT_1352881 [Mycena filopes]|nr:hypothetical protein C8R46DRAFT_1352881 [Mycena filopes]
MASLSTEESKVQPQREDEGQMIALNELELRKLTARHNDLLNIETAALFLSLIVANVLLAAHRPADEDLISVKSCVSLLTRKPQLHDTLKAAHAKGDYRAVAESPLLPPFVSATARSNIETLRPRLEKLIHKNQILATWDPKIEHPRWKWDEDTLSHLRSLNLVCPSPFDRSFSIILHDLGGFQGDPVLNRRTSEIFTKENKFLVNTSGSGKTRLLYEGLCVNWGFYFTYKVDTGSLGSCDVKEVIDSIRSSPDFIQFPELDRPEATGQMAINSEITFHSLGSLLLARLLVFQLFLEMVAATPGGITAEHKQRWLLLQLSPLVLAPPHSVVDPFAELADILDEDRTLHLQDDITGAYQKIQTLLDNSFHPFIVLDEAQDAATDFENAFATRKPLLTEIVRVWSSQLKDKDCSFIYAGTNIPKGLFDDATAAGGDYTWCSNTGSFDDPTTQERYVTKFLPPSLSTTPSGRLLIARIWLWLRGRHRLTASLVYSLLNGSLKTPHTRLSDYITEFTAFEPLDALEELRAEGLPRFNRRWPEDFVALNFSGISVETKYIFLDILFRYMATHQASPAFGPEHIKLLNSDWALCTDKELSTISVTEPLVLVAAARKLLPHPDTLFTVHEYTTYHPNNRPATFLGSMRLSAPRTARALSHCLVFYLARVFGEPRPLSDIFNFPHKVPTWANQSGQLVRFHRDETLEVKNSTVSHTDASLPLATEASSVEQTTAWLEHQHGTAFCLPSSSIPDILFVLKLADGSFIWVALRAIATDEPIQVDDLKTALSQLEAKSLFTDECDDASHVSALDALQTLPHRSSKLGTHSLLRVVFAFPVEIDLERCVNKRSRDVASLSFAALEGTDAEVTQPEFFDSIVAGVLAGSKHTAALDDDGAGSESGRKRSRAHEPATEDEEGDNLELPAQNKRVRREGIKLTETA